MHISSIARRTFRANRDRKAGQPTPCGHDRSVAAAARLATALAVAGTFASTTAATAGPEKAHVGLPQEIQLAADSAPQITEDQAKEIALKSAPGTATDVAIERKLGANRYVVEILSEKDGSEIDVIIDMNTGAVLAIDD